MTTARGGHTATVLDNGKVLIAGGTNGSAGLASAEIYDPDAGTFAPTGSMNVAKNGPTATVLLDRTVLVAGGFDEDQLPLGERGDLRPKTPEHSRPRNMPVARGGHTATLLLPSGMVLFAGGGLDDLAVGAELFDPKLRNIHRHRRDDRSKARPHGDAIAQRTVLVAGGRDIFGNPSRAQNYTIQRRGHSRQMAA